MLIIAVIVTLGCQHSPLSYSDNHLFNLTIASAATTDTNKAEKAVKYLEDHQSRDNIADAKNKTDLVTDEGTKANLINRINLVENAIAAKAAPTTESAASSQEDRTVYVTGGGKSHVYWYSTESMPWNTNRNNIVEMKESEAIAAGKRHSLTER